MENIGDEFKHYWETQMFYQTEELDSWGLDEPISGYYDSSSPDGGASSSAASKNIVSERNRRKKLNDRLFALRAVVPHISKMDKASIIKDAIEYIQDLHKQEKSIEAEITELESGMNMNMNMNMNMMMMSSNGVNQNSSFEYEQDLPVLLRSKRNKTEQQLFESVSSRTSPIEVHELRVTYMGEKTVVVSLTCSKRTDTMVKLCEMFESLKLKIITANITCFSGRLLKTVFIQADEEEKDVVQIKIQAAIAALNDLESPMTM
ncbi:transcription factor bHLH35-like isoform X2 [Prosopis cineraria]|uniref:transcription factor bHLH35-like isoform X2 n=1 Tax=Prosopis cineraria TaxID=364024 RepID=UPI00240F7A01|nr:transcription factor bHLH35-like isoform X2 [Prosopis cineraria]